MRPAHKRVFTDEENKEIYFACYQLRTGLIVNAPKYSTTTGVLNITPHLSHGLAIHKLIMNRGWKELFENKEWLQVLLTASDVNAVGKGFLRNQLRIILRYFPTETKGYLKKEFIL